MPAPEASFEELKAGIPKGTIILVDVRTPDLLKTKGTITGSFNIPLADIDGAFKMEAGAFKAKYKFDKNSPQICFIGNCSKCSGEAAEKVKSSIPENSIKVYSGGTDDFQAKTASGTTSAKKLWGKGMGK